MELDLAASQRRLQQRTKEVSEKAKRQLEKERIARERQASRQAALEEEQRARRLAQVAADEEARTDRAARHVGRRQQRPRRGAQTPTHPPHPLPAQERLRVEAEVAANAGVVYRAQLLAVPAPASIAADKGIKRAADKVPRSSPPSLP